MALGDFKMVYDEINFNDQCNVQSKIYWLLFFQKLDLVFTIYRNDLLEILQFATKKFSYDDFFEIHEKDIIYGNGKEIKLKNDDIEKLKKFLIEIKTKFSNFIYPNFCLHLKKMSLAIYPSLSSEYQIIQFYLNNVAKKEYVVMKYFTTYKLFNVINYFGYTPYSFFVGIKFDQF